MHWILSYEAVIRLGAFAGIFGLMAIWEVVSARRELTAAKSRRWFGNLSVIVIDTLIVRLLFPTAAVGMALAAENLSWGLFRNVDAPYWLAVLVSVALLDFAIYLQHVMFHAHPGSVAPAHGPPRRRGLRCDHRHPVSPH